MTDAALDLAYVALCTPLLDASETLDVLVDVLLEREEIRPRGYRHKEAREAERNMLRKQAWDWAVESTLTLFGKMERAVDRINASAPRPSSILMNPADFNQLQQMLNAGLITPDDALGLAGLPDLGISTSRHVPRGAMYSVPIGDIDERHNPRPATIDDAAGFAIPVRLT